MNILWRLLFCASLALGCTTSNADQAKDEQLIIDFINTRTDISEQVKTKAAYLTISIGQVFTANWEDSDVEYKTIADDVNMSSDCLLQACDKETTRCLELLDQIQAFQTNTPEKRFTFSKFMQRLMATPHEAPEVSKELCSKLI